jgi:hypothetical protein
LAAATDATSKVPRQSRERRFPKDVIMRGAAKQSKEWGIIFKAG